ncbi:unnamed protein product, partial [Amoebophrya sp. A120]|eukprot:GSA120T00008476001.1
MGGRHSKDDKPGNPNQKNKPVSRTTDQDRTLLQLKLQRDDLNKQKKRFANLIEEEAIIVNTCLREKKKQLALFHLKKKTIHGKMLTNCDNALLKLLELIDNVELLQMQQSVVQAMQVGNDMLKKMRKEVSVEKVEDLLEDAEELREWNAEINAVMAQYGVSEEDIDAELAMIEEQETLRVLEPLKPVPVTELNAVSTASSSKDRTTHVEKEHDEVQRERIPIAIPAFCKH